MALLSTLRHRVYSYLSPAHTNRDNNSSSSSMSSRLEQRLDRRSMSPATRTKNWLARNTPSTDFSNGRTPSILGVQGGRITKRVHQGKTTLSPPIEARYRDERYWDAALFNKKAAYANDEDDEDDEDMDGLEEDAEDKEEDAPEDVVDDDEENDDDLDYDDDDYEDDLGNDTTLVAADNEADEAGNDTTLVAAVVADAEEEDDAGEGPSNINQGGQGEPDVEVDVEKERAEREAAVKNAEKGDWSEAEITLFQRLNMRGFEPLLPGTWRLDLNTIPESLFTNQENEALIGSITAHNFRAVRAFTSLMTLGIRVRDRLSISQAPEVTMRREIDSYIRWSHRDAALSGQNHIPVLAISTATAGQSTQDAIDSVTARLQHLAGLYREKWRIHPSVEGSGENDQGDKGKGKGKEKEKEQDKGKGKEKEKSQDKGKGKEKEKSQDKGKGKEKEKSQDKGKGKGKEKEPEKEKQDEFEHELPTLYGLVIVHTVVALVTLNANHPDAPVRSIAQFDFSDEDHDVWNAFAIAIVVNLARDYLVSIREFDSQVAGPQNQSDPDA